MSMPYGQQRRLRQAERALCVADPRMAAMFSVFARLTVGESLPQQEQFQPPRAFPVVAVCAVAAVVAALGRLTVRAVCAVGRALRHAGGACLRVFSQQHGPGTCNGVVPRQGSPWG